MSAAVLHTPVARIVKTHGLTGEVVVVPIDGLPFIPSVGVEVRFVPPRAGVGPATVVSSRPTPKGHLLRFSDVDGDLARSLVGATLLMRGEDIPEDSTTPEDEEDEFIGAQVVDEERGFIGTVAEVIVTGANDVWVLEGGPFGEVLIPVIDQVVLGWEDDDRKTIAVSLLEGLIPGEGEEA